MPGSRPFITAEWRNLVMLNYAAEPSLLEQFIPRGTELDLWQGRAVISLVGFQFLNTRFHGWRVPFHRNFTEVNLRFYVRREAADGWRRGVVFLREIVPKPVVSWIANAYYHERYVTLPMSHRVQLPASATDRTGQAVYGWRIGRTEFRLAAEFSGLPQMLKPGSEAEFITEHYWGYTKRPDGSTTEYGVAHPAWRVWPADRAVFTGDAREIYGREFAEILRRPPTSALIAEGSPVSMVGGTRLAAKSPAIIPAAVGPWSQEPAK